MILLRAMALPARRRQLILFFLVSLTGVFSSAQESTAQFIRFIDGSGEWQGRLQTSIVSYRNESGVTLNLVAAVHLADIAYYDQLNRFFQSQDAVLYELVADPDQRPQLSKATQEQQTASPISLMQRTMANVLNVGFQLEHIDYSQANFRHADLSPAQLQAIMEAKNENSFSMFLSLALAQSLSASSQTAETGVSSFAMFRALMNNQQGQAVKYLVAKELGNAEISGLSAEFENQLTILGDRNQAALKVLEQSLLESNLKQISVFYGAAHMPGLERALISDFGFVRQGEQWLDAWKIP